MIWIIFFACRTAVIEVAGTKNNADPGENSSTAAANIASINNRKLVGP